MSLEIPIKSSLNWFENEINFSMELIGSFIEGTERQALDSFNNYQQEKVEIVDKQGGKWCSEYFQGLDDSTWDLQDIFQVYFPSLQRSSALVTIFSFFENELNKLCETYREEHKLRISLRDLQGNGIDKAINYLEKVVNINMQKTSHSWQEIKNIQKIRNLIVHTNGNLLSENDQVKKHEEEYAKKHKLLHVKSNYDIVILDGYLSQVLKVFHEYFSIVNKDIQEKNT